MGDCLGVFTLFDISNNSKNRLPTPEKNNNGELFFDEGIFPFRA
jgi:hypothetical protein